MRERKRDKGPYHVIGIDTFEATSGPDRAADADYFIGEFQTKLEAVTCAKGHLEKARARSSPGLVDSVLVYSGDGRLVWSSSDEPPRSR